MGISASITKKPVKEKVIVDTSKIVVEGAGSEACNGEYKIITDYEGHRQYKNGDMCIWMRYANEGKDKDEKVWYIGKTEDYHYEARIKKGEDGFDSTDPPEAALSKIQIATGRFLSEAAKGKALPTVKFGSIVEKIEGKSIAEEVGLSLPKDKGTEEEKEKAPNGEAVEVKE